MPLKGIYIIGFPKGLPFGGIIRAEPLILRSNYDNVGFLRLSLVES